MKNRIRELRAEKNITQLRLSLELEVSQETVSAYDKRKASAKSEISDQNGRYFPCQHRLSDRTL